MHSLAIVIPIYKSFLDILERLSIISLFTKLSRPISNHWSINIVTYKDCDLSNIEELANKYNISLNIEYFDNNYFLDTDSYSRLCKSFDFYNRFITYEYMLIYQTDVYTVKDNLEYWLSLNLDYIGAPIFATDANWEYVPAIGNGGCSLRKVSVFRDITDPNGNFLKSYKDILDKIDEKNNGLYSKYEDLYFAQLVYKYYDFEKARLKEAINFAIDMNPDTALKVSGNVIPTFIHAFGKNNRVWQKYIPEMSDMSIISNTEWKYNTLYQSYLKNVKDYINPIYTKVVTYFNNNTRYLKEWIEYHLLLGINKIEIYDMSGFDNHDIDTIDISIYRDNIKINNEYKGRFSTKSFIEACNKSYKEDDNIDWVIFLHQYEYLSLIDYDCLTSNSSNIIEYPILKYTDSELLYDDNRKCIDRFDDFNETKEYRMFIKTGIPNFNIEFIEPENYPSFNKEISSIGQILSYPYKTASEYKEYLYNKKDINNRKYTPNRFFELNKKTEEKMNILGINSSIEVE